MTLTSERKISILIIWTFLVGIIIWLFFARMSEMKKSKEILTFSTQSIGGEEKEIPMQQIPCPRSEQLHNGDVVTFGNPLVEKGNEIFSLQQGIISENYLLRWPSITSNPWKGQLIEHTIDNVTPGMEKGNGLCVYSSLGKDIALLRQDNIWRECIVLTTSTFKWFSCPLP